MIENFESPKYLLDHVNKDLQKLITINKEAFATGAYQHIVDREPKTGHKRFKVKFTGTIPSDARYLANNIITNARHSLDQALAASVEILTGKPAGLIYFPFSNSLADLRGRLKSRAYQTVPVALRPILEGFQPYPRGEGYIGGNDFLCAIAKANGPNKHQITLTPGFAMGPQTYIRALEVKGYAYEVIVPPVWDMANGELIIAITADDAEVRYDLQTTFHIAFGDAGPLFRQPVIPALHKFIGIAQSIVLGLEAETRRIVGV